VSDPWWAKPGGAPSPGQRWQPAPQRYPTPTPAAPPPPSPNRQRPILLWGGLVVVVLVIVAAVLAGVLWGGSLNGRELDVRSAESGVTAILSDPINGYGANDVTDVTCNNGENPPIHAGKGFRCDVQINGQRRSVDVVFSDDSGTYAVDGPR
jgi:hypothetical protein